MSEQTPVEMPAPQPLDCQSSVDTKTTRPEGVGSDRQPARPKREIENLEWLPFLRRIIEAAITRVGNGDIEDLAVLLDIQADFDRAVREAVHIMREHGASWADIARAAGTSRQAAQQRWGY